MPFREWTIWCCLPKVPYCTIGAIGEYLDSSILIFNGECLHEITAKRVPFFKRAVWCCLPSVPQSPVCRCSNGKKLDSPVLILNCKRLTDVATERVPFFERTVWCCLPTVQYSTIGTIGEYLDSSVLVMNGDYL